MTEKKSNSMVAWIALIVAITGGGVATAEFVSPDIMPQEIPEHVHPLTTHTHEVSFHEHPMQVHEHSEIQSHVHPTPPAPEPFDHTPINQEMAEMQAQIDANYEDLLLKISNLPDEQPSSSSNDQQLNDIRLFLETTTNEIISKQDHDDELIHQRVTNLMQDHDDDIEEIEDRIDDVEDDVSQTQEDIENIFGSLQEICDRYQWDCKTLAEEFEWR